MSLSPIKLKIEFQNKLCFHEINECVTLIFLGLEINWQVKEIIFLEVVAIKEF